MSKVQVDKVVNLSDDGAPQLTYGAELPVGYGLTGAGGLNISGVVTAASAVFSGNVTIGGTLTYEDVTNIDVVGVSTFAGRMNVNSTINANEGLNVSAGVITAPSGFSGDLLIEDKIVHTGDTNTAIRFPSADTITAETGGSEALRVDSSGRLLVGSTSGTAGSYTYKLLASDQITSSEQTFGIQYAGTVTYGLNAESNSDFTIKKDGTERLRITSAGDVGIGTIAPASGADLHLHAESTAVRMQFTNSNTGVSDSDGVRLMIDSSNNFEILQREDANIEFFTDNSERMRLDGDGRLLIGKTSGSFKLEVSGDESTMRLTNSGESGAGNENVKIVAGGSHYSNLVHVGSGISFRTYNGSSEGQRMTLDANGRLLINQTSVGSKSATAPLQLVSATTGAFGVNIAMRSQNDYGFLSFTDNDASEDLVQLGVLRSAADTGNLLFYTNGGNTSATERLRLTSNGDVGINCTPATDAKLHIKFGTNLSFQFNSGQDSLPTISSVQDAGAYNGMVLRSDNFRLFTGVSPAERLRVDNQGRALFNTTVNDPADDGGSSNTGTTISEDGYVSSSRSAGESGKFGRVDNDGIIVNLYQDGTAEGNISVSGSTVSYNGGHLSRWSQLVGISTNVKSDRPTIYQGTVMSNLDAMCEWTGETNQQLNKTKVSDTVSDKDVAGVFWAWDDDDDVYTNDFYIAMTGDMVIRVGAATTITRGDLLESAGDGTAKPQSDDIVRSKTVAKITSTTSTATYSDGSKAYPCVLMAC